MRLRARPVANLDRSSKARMIEAFIRAALGRSVSGLHVLDLGCGNGDIGAHFAKDNLVCSCDVHDRCRPEHAALLRCIGRSERLPFADGSFDLVLSHHVIEHVDDQQLHLAEIHRVLRPEGICYLATPNLSSPLMRGHVGNPKVLRYRQMAPLFARHHFVVEEWYAHWLHDPDRYHCPVRLGRFLPYRAIHALRRWFPSQCFLLRLPREVPVLPPTKAGR